MKVLHVIDSGGYYGAEVMLVELALAQLRAGLNVEVCSIGTLGETEKAIEKVCREKGVKVYPLRMKAGLNLVGGLKVIRYARNNGYQLLHSHGYKGNILLGVIPKFIRKLPIVTTVHGYTNSGSIDKMWLYEHLDRIIVRFIEYVVLVSSKMLEIPVFSKMNQSKISVIYNGIDQSEENSKNGDKAIEIPQHKIVLGTIGRLSPEKNHALLIKMIKLLKQQDVDAFLLIVGEGGLRHQLETLIKECDVEDRVHITGYVDNASHLIQHFDMYLISSTTEGLPITLLESMRASRPVISTAVGEVTNILKEFDLLVDSTPEAFASKVLNFIKQPEQLEQYGLALNQKFVRQFTSDTMSNAYTAAYKKLLSN